MAPLNATSTTPTTTANINEAINTNIELFCSSAYFGQETFVVISMYESLINATNVDIGLIRFLFFAREVGIEPTTNGFGDRYSTN